MTDKQVEQRIGYAIEDGRLDAMEAEDMTIEEMKEWLASNDSDYDPY